jgi:hypothetical protein
VSGDGALWRGCAAGGLLLKGLLSTPPVKGHEGGRGGWEGAAGTTAEAVTAEVQQAILSSRQRQDVLLLSVIYVQVPQMQSERNQAVHISATIVHAQLRAVQHSRSEAAHLASPYSLLPQHTPP